ncbi:hypothetical protein [Paenibacillus cymbidii]|uniref:hypothetical protein n=1 Tax=Paenibacillus cymbidii TaxID=1639034 RepID=UPI0010811662|nr:hypothetical protein [Paenibacillus cymbidii]
MIMRCASIHFQFDDRRSALLAMDTLQELGYLAVPLGSGDSGNASLLEVAVEKCDLTSALEIAHAHGGMLLEGEAGDAGALTMAYGLDAVPIPAHLVEPAEEEGEAGYDHFPAGIHL